MTWVFCDELSNSTNLSERFDTRASTINGGGGGGGGGGKGERADV